MMRAAPGLAEDAAGQQQQQKTPSGRRSDAPLPHCQGRGAAGDSCDGGDRSATTTTTTQRQGAGRGAAAVLLLTHILEIGLMLTGTLSLVLPTLRNWAHAFPEGLTLKPSDTVEPPLTLPPLPPNSKTSEITLAAHVILLSVPMLIITSVSLVWAVRAQDFSGRRAARLVCWLLHAAQASLVWRYLKVQLVYDASDVAELGTLRFLQVHVQTLPFVVVFIVTTLASSLDPWFALVLAASLLLSTVTTVVVATTVRNATRASTLTLPTITQVCHSPIHGRTRPSRYEDLLTRVVVGITTMCLLWSRSLAISALFSLHLTWASMLLLGHWLGAMLWLGFQEGLLPVGLSPARQVLRRTFLAYLLVWDWHVFRDDVSGLNVCARPRLPAAFYTITAAQNVVTLVTWYVVGRDGSPHATLRIATLVSVICAQGLALLLLTLSYLYCSSLLPSWPSKSKTRSMINSALPSPPALVTPSHPKGAPSQLRSAHPTAVPANQQESGDRSDGDAPSSYVDFKDVEDGLDDDDVDEVNVSTTSPSCPHMGPTTSTPRYPALPLPPRLMAHHLPPNMFSFSHDLLPAGHRAAKSERSSTDNGSFNSRNTNTIVPTSNHISEYDLLHRAHGSFSDSFSSLSCGTVNKAATPKPPLTSRGPLHTSPPTPPVPPVRLKRHTSCKNGFCHCKIFDGVDGRCDEADEDGVVGEEQRGKSVPPEKADPAGELVTKSGGGGGGCGGVGGGGEGKHAKALHVSLVRGSQRFHVLCASCLQAHDPLLSTCNNEVAHRSGRSSCPGHRLTISRSCGGLTPGGSSTDYPSDTELTATLETLSSTSAESHSTYTTWPVGRGPGMARLLQVELGGHDYVTAWLKHQQQRGSAPPPPPQGPLRQQTRHRSHDTYHAPRRPRRGRNKLNPSLSRLGCCNDAPSCTNPPSPLAVGTPSSGLPRRTPLLRSVPIMQDLETVV